jgi:hypothetical protein
VILFDNFADSLVASVEALRDSFLLFPEEGADNVNEMLQALAELGLEASLVNRQGMESVVWTNHNDRVVRFVYIA